MAELQFFVMPDDGLEPLLNVLAAVERRLDIYLFKLENDKVEHSLRAAAKRGVEVRAILDNNADTAAEAYRRLEQDGVAVRWAPPYFVKTHAKCFVADGRQVAIFTVNFVSGWQHTRDYGIINDDPAIIAALNTCFLADWEQQQARPSVQDCGPLIISPINSRTQLLAYIGAAKQQLLVQHEQFDDDGVLAALAERANAGVKVTMVMGEERSAAAVSRLQQVAPSVQAFFPDKHKLDIHAKLIIRDNADMLLGSLNLTGESIDHRREVCLIVSDSGAVRRATATFDQDFASKNKAG